MTEYAFSYREHVHGVNEPTEQAARVAVAAFITEQYGYLVELDPAELAPALTDRQRKAVADQLRAKLEQVERDLRAIESLARNAGLDALAGVTSRTERPVHLATIAARQAAGIPAFAD